MKRVRRWWCYLCEPAVVGEAPTPEAARAAFHRHVTWWHPVEPTP